MKTENIAIARQRYIAEYIRMYKANLRSTTNFFLSALYFVENMLVAEYGVPSTHMAHIRESILNKENGSNNPVIQDSVQTVLL